MKSRSTLLALLLVLLSLTALGKTKIDGAWVLSEKWEGYMGIALVIHDESFKYWFYSDVVVPGDETRYPIAGRVEEKDGEIRLKAKADARLYDTMWRQVQWQGELCLLSQKDFESYVKSGVMPVSRLLYRVQKFDEAHPIMNRVKE